MFCNITGDSAMAMNGIRGNGQTQPNARRTTVRPRVTFKKNCKGDFITINVSGRIFEADNSIFKQHPGKTQISVTEKKRLVEPIYFCNFRYVS